VILPKTHIEIEGIRHTHSNMARFRLSRSACRPVEDPILRPAADSPCVSRALSQRFEAGALACGCWAGGLPPGPCQNRRLALTLRKRRSLAVHALTGTRLPSRRRLRKFELV